MWTLLTGYLLATFFEYQIVKLFKNKFLKNTLSFYEVSIGWLFQEYTRKRFLLTGGKKFILEIDFRNRLFTQSFKIVQNLIMHSYITTTLELGTFVILFFFFLLILIKPKAIAIQKYKKWKIICDNVFLLLLLNYAFKHTFFKTDIFFVFVPIFFSLFLIFQLYVYFLIIYLTYVCIIDNSIKIIALTLKVFVMKSTFYFLSIGFFFLLFFQDLSLQNIVTENFSKELLFKFSFIFFQVICLK